MEDENRTVLPTENTEGNANNNPDSESGDTSFNIEQYEKNLEDNSVSEETLRYQTLIKNQDQLISNLRDEIKTLKEKNLNLASSVSTVDTQKPQSTTDILASAFL